MQKPGIAVLDFGSQYTQTIARRFRQLNTFSEIFEPETWPAELVNASGIVLSGGPNSVYQPDAPRCIHELFEIDKPIWGICYGFQYIAHVLGGKVERKERGEYGKAQLNIHKNVGVLENLGPREQAWMSHGDTVTKLPDGYEAVASTDDCEYAVAWNPAKKIIGTQFHPEVDDTPNGMRMLDNFLKICGATAHDWTMEKYIADSLENIPRQVDGRKVCHLTSGGGDSTVAAVMLKLALEPGQAEFVYMDPGIMRKGETEYVKKIVGDIGLDLTVLDTSELLEEQLTGVIEPEKKRWIIGSHFANAAENYWKSKADGCEWLLGQGTIYPDHIESKGTKHAAKIKTHHNRVEEILRLMTMGRVIEPNLYLFKDELRELARTLADKYPEYKNLGAIFAKRHPFPGPGLAIRMLCSDGKAEDTNGLSRKADMIAKKYNLKASVLPIKSVGVQGDERSYAHPALLQGDVDGWDLLDAAATNITNELRGNVNRVVYAWEPHEVSDVSLHAAYVTRERLDKLREADAIVMGELERNDWMDKIWQCPTISLPIGLNNKKADTIVLRPVNSKDAMTASFSRIPKAIVDRMAEGVVFGLGYSGLLYDITNKPPGTIEWE